MRLLLLIIVLGGLVFWDVIQNQGAYTRDIATALSAAMRSLADFLDQSLAR